MDVDANTQDKEIHTDDKATIIVNDSNVDDNLVKKQRIDDDTDLTFTAVNNQSVEMEENISCVEIKNKFNENKDSIKRKLSLNDCETSEVYSKKIKFDEENCIQDDSGIISLKNKEKLSDLNNGNKTQIVELPDDICAITVHTNKKSLFEDSLNGNQIPNNNNNNTNQDYVEENVNSCSDVELLYEKVVKIIEKIDSEIAQTAGVNIDQHKISAKSEKDDINERIVEAVNNTKNTNVENVSKCVGKDKLVELEMNGNKNCLPQMDIVDSEPIKTCETLENAQVESFDKDCTANNLIDTTVTIIEHQESINVVDNTCGEILSIKVIKKDFANDENVVSQSIIETADNCKIKNDCKDIITISDDESIAPCSIESHKSTIIDNNDKANKVTDERLIDKNIADETISSNEDNKMQKQNQNSCLINATDIDKKLNVTNSDNDVIELNDSKTGKMPINENLSKESNKVLDLSESLEEKADIKIEYNLEFNKDNINSDVKSCIVENQKIITEIKNENDHVIQEINIPEVQNDVESKFIVNNDNNDVVIITDDEDEEEENVKNENLSISTKSFSSESDDAMKQFCADNTVEDSAYNISMEGTNDESTNTDQCKTQQSLNRNNDDKKIINKNVCILNSNKGTSTPNSKNNSTHCETNVSNITPIKKCDNNSKKMNEHNDLKKNNDIDHAISLDCNDDIEMQEIHDASTDSTNCCTTSGSDTEAPILSDGITRYTKFVKKYNEEKLNLQHQASNNLQIDTKSNDCLLGTETSEDNLYEINIVYEENEMHSLNIEKINMKKLSSSSKRSSSNGSVTSLGQFQLPSKTTISSSSSSSGSGLQQQQSRLSTNLSPSTSLSTSSIKSNIRTSDNQKTYDGKFVIPQLPKKIRQTIRGTLALCNFMIEHFNKLKQINKSNIANIHEIVNNNDNEDTLSINESNFESMCTMSPILNKNNNASIANNLSITSPTLVQSIMPENDDFENDSIFLNNNISTRQIGNIVLARWNDRKYYSGTIQNKLSNNKYMILFDDNAVKTISKKYLLFSYNNVLPLIDQNIHIINKPNTSELGLVISYNFNRGDNKVYYTVMTEGSTCIVTSSDIFLSEDQMKIINQNLNSTVIKLCNDLISTSTLDFPVVSTNIVKPTEAALDPIKLSSTDTTCITPPTTTTSTAISNVRVTRSRRVGNDDSGLKIKSPQAGFSGGIVGRRKRPTKRQQLAPTTISESSDISDSIEFDSAPNSPDSALEAVDGVQPELQKTRRESEISKINLIADFLGNNESRLEELLGPIVTKKKLFKNKHFLLTCTIPIKKRSNNPDEMKFSSIPYYKDYLIKQIEAGGGKVHSHFEDVPNDIYKKCKLIAPYPCVTAKYIQCLACDIQAVSHEWIIKCCQRNNLIVLKQFLLPSGWSVVNETYIRWIPGKTNDQRLSKSPFVGVKILIASHNKDFVEFWNRVCKLNGATVNIIKNMNDITKNTKGYMLTDQDFSQDVIIKAEHFGIEIVSTVWIVENLIVGKIIPPNTNKKLKQMYQDDDDY